MSRGTRTVCEAKPTRASSPHSAKLLWSMVRRRRCGDCVVKDRVLTWGDLALRLLCEAAAKPKGDGAQPEQEVSKGRSSPATGQGPNEKEGDESCRLKMLELRCRIQRVPDRGRR